MKDWKEVIGCCLVAAAGVLGTYACYLFETKIKDELAQDIIELFV